MGAIVAGGFARPSVVAHGADPAPGLRAAASDGNAGRAASPPLVNFADVVERINPAVVNIDATSSGSASDSATAPPPGAA